MSDDVLPDHAAQLIADARVACLKLAIPPGEIAKIMMDEAILALMAERLSLSDIQARFKKYTKRDLPRLSCPRRDQRIFEDTIDFAG
jgi:chorismate mutase